MSRMIRQAMHDHLNAVSYAIADCKSGVSEHLHDMHGVNDVIETLEDAMLKVDKANRRLKYELDKEMPVEDTEMTQGDFNQMAQL